MSLEARKPKTVWMFGHRVTLIPCGDANFALEITTPPGVSGPPPHYHTDSDEMFHVFEGALELSCNGQWLRVEAGEGFTVPRGAVHTFRNPTGEDARWLTGWNPLGFQEWFARYGVDASTPDAEARSLSEDVVAAAVAATASFGMVLAEG
ncbi:MAG TPA: cupin domain-containing protein [Candidatus Sulfomarinibacteraceae bacterium]|nr:cupin domain-containing protein [Candidatus Sulfomarinibacteraceae bacterium]